jgi:uncharacterized protein (TIGR04255 family)
MMSHPYSGMAPCRMARPRGADAFIVEVVLSISDIASAMDAPTIKLKSAPIIEAVVDFECDMPVLPDFKMLERPARDAYRSTYERFHPVFMQEHSVDISPEAPKVSVKDQGIQGYRFFQSDQKQLVQVRATGFSFNRLAPYGSFDDYIPEIQRTWNLFLDFAKPVGVRFVRLRYVNRILLPLGESGVGLGDYFKICPHLPDEEQLIFTGFFNQHAAKERDTGHDVSIVLASQLIENGRLPVLFDITVADSRPADPKNWLELRDRMASLRRLKNEVFYNTLTQRCIDLFQI